MLCAIRSKTLNLWQFQARFLDDQGRASILKFRVELRDSVQSGMKSISINGQEVIPKIKIENFGAIPYQILKEPLLLAIRRSSWGLATPNYDLLIDEHPFSKIIASGISFVYKKGEHKDPWFDQQTTSTKPTDNQGLTWYDKLEKKIEDLTNADIHSQSQYQQLIDDDNTQRTNDPLDLFMPRFQPSASLTDTQKNHLTMPISEPSSKLVNEKDDNFWSFEFQSDLKKGSALKEQKQEIQNKNKENQSNNIPHKQFFDFDQQIVVRQQSTDQTFEKARDFEDLISLQAQQQQKIKENQVQFNRFSMPLPVFPSGYQQPVLPEQKNYNLNLNYVMNEVRTFQGQGQQKDQYMTIQKEKLQFMQQQKSKLDQNLGALLNLD